METSNNTNNTNQSRDFTWIIKKMVLIALGVGLASHLVSGISYDSGSTLLAVVVLFCVLNIVIKPLLILFTLPFMVLTLGFGVWLINGLFFVLVSKIIDGFHVESFMAALWGALIVSLVSVIANAIFGAKVQKTGTGGRAKRHLDKSKDDVIDV